MSNKTVNLAGKDLVVNSIKSMRGASEQEYMLSAVKGSTKRNTQTATASLTRLGARANASDSTSIDIYACDPRKAYSTNYGDSFYVDTAYASFNGLSFPVYIRTKKVTLSPDRNGTWAIVIKKVTGSEVWGVHIAFPSPVTAGGQTTMSWQEPGSVSFAIDDTTWVVGSFLYDSDITSQNYGVYGIVMHNEVLTPASFLKNRFMQIIGDAEGSDTDDFTSWAVAMGCDAIFKRLAALEAFVSRLKVNFLEVGNGTDSPSGGFFMHIFGGATPEILAKYNGSTLWEIDPDTGKMYGNFARVRQYMPFQFDDSLDSSHPMECSFYIPPNSVIVSIKLSSIGTKYRAYSNASGTKTWASNSVLCSVSGGLPIMGDQAFGTLSGMVTTDISHSHALVFGIYESTVPSGVELYCSNDGSTYGSAVSQADTGANNSNLDITANFSGTGWKKIKFTSTRLGRIQAQLIIELLVTT